MAEAKIVSRSARPLLAVAVVGSRGGRGRGGCRGEKCLEGHAVVRVGGRSSGGDEFGEQLVQF